MIYPEIRQRTQDNPADFQPRVSKSDCKSQTRVQRRWQRMEFLVATIFPGLRGNCVGAVGCGHPSNCVMSWVVNWLICTSCLRWFYRIPETGDPLLLLILTHILDSRILGKCSGDQPTEKTGRNFTHPARATRFKSLSSRRFLARNQGGSKWVRSRLSVALILKWRRGTCGSFELRRFKMET
jgi:hypothetical protein